MVITEHTVLWVWPQDLGSHGGGTPDTGVVLQISSDRDDRRILGIQDFYFGMFLGSKILGGISLGSLIRNLGIFSGIQNNLKIHDSSHASWPHTSTNKFLWLQNSVFWEVKFWSRDFLSFA